LQRKANTELSAFVSTHVRCMAASALLLNLPLWNGDRSVLTHALAATIDAPVSVRNAIQELQAIADCLQQRAPQVALYFDLSELRGYHYHTGVVFSLYVEGAGEAIANGGRYDNFGAAFGRARPASGFSADLKYLMQWGDIAVPPTAAIRVTLDGTAAQWQTITQLRATGECVITTSHDEKCDTVYTRELVREGTQFIVKNL
jgi:ATP phosphoribosyltransferase regulatory subunit